MQLYSQGFQRDQLERTFEGATITPSLQLPGARSKGVVRAAITDAVPSAGAGAIIAVLVATLGVLLVLAAANVV